MKRIKTGILFMALFFGLTGCQMEQSAATQSTQTGTVYQIRQQPFNLGEAVSLFLGKTMEETKKKGAEIETDYYHYEDEEQSLSGGAFSDGTGFFLQYCDYTDNAGMAYYWASDCYEHKNDFADWGIRKAYPEDELTACSKEEALRYCRPYAEFMGYKEAEVTVCAMTQEMLEDVRKNFSAGAPVRGAKKATDSDDEVANASVAWTKEDEAYYIIYKPYLGGKLMESVSQLLEIIYVPKYKKIMYASGLMPWLADQKAGEEKILSSEAAVEKVKQLHGVQNERDIKIEKTSLVYSLNWDFAKEKKASLCWRVDYELKNSAQYKGNQAFRAKLVDAVTGEFCTNFKED